VFLRVILLSLSKFCISRNIRRWYHSLYGSTRCRISRQAKVMGNGAIQSMDFRNPLNDFHETWNIELSPEIYSRAKLSFWPTTWVVWENSQFVTSFLSLPFWSLHLAHRSDRWTRRPQNWSVGVFYPKGLYIRGQHIQF